MSLTGHLNHRNNGEDIGCKQEISAWFHAQIFWWNFHVEISVEGLEVTGYPEIGGSVGIAG